MSIFDFWKKPTISIKPLIGGLVLAIDESALNHSSYNLPFLLSAPNGIFEVIQGKSPFKITTISINDIIVEDISLNSNSDTFHTNTISTIRFNLNLDKFKELKQGKSFIAIKIRDQEFNSAKITFPLDTSPVFSRIKVTELISVTSLNLSFSRNFSIPNMPYINVAFGENSKITVFGRDKPKITISFSPESHLRDHNILSGDLSSSMFTLTNTYTFPSFSTNITNLEEFSKNKEKTIKVTIEVQTLYGELSLELEVDIIDLTREVRKQIIDQKDYKQFTESDLVAVHMTQKSFANRFISRPLIGKSILYASPMRPSIHFTLNHIVVPHGAAPEGWVETTLAIIIPFEKLKKNNKNTFYGGPTVDVSFIGFVKLPKDTVYVERSDEESWSSFTNRINNTLFEMGYKIMPGGEWNWGDSLTVGQWLQTFAKQNSWPTTLPHFHTDLGHAERKLTLQDIAHLPFNEQSKIWRERYLQELKKFKKLSDQFGKIFRAWHSYWNKTLK
jgi:hypothetical protein